MLAPFYWMLATSFKFERDVFTIPIEWIPRAWNFNNYFRVWVELNYLRYFINTSLVTFFTTTGQVLLSALAAYSLAKLHYPGRDKLFLGYLATLMIPWYAIMIPQFMIMQKMNLYDTHISLILLRMFSPFGVFLLRQFFINIPNELLESARIDGCPELFILWKIVLPLSGAAISTLVIFAGVQSWNDFTGPLIYLATNEKFTIQLAIRMFRTQFRSEVAMTMAATVCSMIPVVVAYVSMQRYFIEGIQFSGIKG
jgi:multiple sugar transport system permease protein